MASPLRHPDFSCHCDNLHEMNKCTTLSATLQAEQALLGLGWEGSPRARKSAQEDPKNPVLLALVSGKI